MVVQFKTDPEAPVVTIESVGATNVVFSWSAVPDTSAYLITLTHANLPKVEKEVSGFTESFQFEDLGICCKQSLTN